MIGGIQSHAPSLEQKVFNMILTHQRSAAAKGLLTFPCHAEGVCTHACAHRAILLQLLLGVVAHSCYLSKCSIFILVMLSQVLPSGNHPALSLTQDKCMRPCTQEALGANAAK